MKKADIKKRVTNLAQQIRPLMEKLKELGSEVEDECYEKSERWQDSEQGEWFFAAVDGVLEAADAIEDSLDSMTDVVA